MTIPISASSTVIPSELKVPAFTDCEKLKMVTSVEESTAMCAF